MIISKVIRQHGFTIEQVADKLGLKRGSLANSIGGNPTVETLQKIADAIGCSRSEFFADEAESQPKQQPANVCPHCGKPINIKIENPET